MLVDGIVKYGRILLEYVLGSVAMMDIEVDNADPLDAPLLLKIAGGDGHIVEVAKPHGFADLGMVPRRPDRTEAVVQFLQHYPAGDIQNAAHCQQGGLIGVVAHLVIRAVKHALSRKAGGLKPLDITSIMNQFDPLHVRAAGFNVNEFR